MRSWDLNAVEVEVHRPEVVDSQDEGRAVLIELPAGEALQEHQVHERATVLVVSGRIGITAPDGGGDVEGGAGLMVVFDPNERHEVNAIEDSRILLLLSPWPGDGHPRHGRGHAD